MIYICFSTLANDFEIAENENKFVSCLETKLSKQGHFVYTGGFLVLSSECLCGILKVKYIM